MLEGSFKGEICECFPSQEKDSHEGLLYNTAIGGDDSQPPKTQTRVGL